MSLKEYNFSVPIKGYEHFAVKANSYEEALEKERNYQEYIQGESRWEHRTMQFCKLNIISLLAL